jgi:NDP-4-keto-2,6-dideoxyhexose 3-C-methyltransferase
MDATLATTTRTTCRVCGSSRLAPAFSLGDLYVSDFVPEPEATGIKAPLDLILCEACTLLQLKHTAPQELMYTRHYWYQSGVTDTMRRALRDITESIERLVRLADRDIVLDIGANDGTLLAAYSNPTLRRVGCEPANNLVDLLRKVTPHVIHGFWEKPAFEQMFPDEKAKVITAIGMFYDMEDPNQFVADAAAVLADDGVFVAQLMCLRPMLEKNDLGNICHEHLEYYSLESLKVLFERNGLEVFKLEENDVNGGSYRLYCRKYRSGSITLRDDFTKQDYADFHARAQKNRDDCVTFIREEVKKGKRVYVYGASTKGNTILQYYGLDHTVIEGAAERSAEKWGKYTVGTLIPIVTEEEARKNADYFLVLPWAFLDEFLRREQEWRSGGGRFIVPLPSFRVI